MKNKKWIWPVGVVLLVVCLIFGFQLLAPSISAKELTEEEANSVVLEKYPGDIIKTTKTESEYQIEMKLETGVYVIKIDAKSGDVKSLVQTEKTGKPVQEQPQQTSKEDHAPPKEPAKINIITEQEAIDIAEKHLKGTADIDDTEFHQVPGQTPYYLVEIEFENGDDNREADVQVDAYTGEVKSVNWDD
ncbi:PepSY domain-containing protein [Psychrobacillus sp. NPDC096426]|uniref:PepSY domain-containing protein n=1 Tax=Psychrobacillus sp. NPDC096426 TaxID=3364491 RepID=UPI0038041FAF